MSSPDLDFQLADDYLLEYYQKYQLPGTTYALCYQGQVVHQKSLGYADIGKQQLVEASTQFRIASMSKSFAAAAIVKLRNQGQLSLEQTVGELLVDLLLDPTVQELTVKELLSMRGRLLTDDPWADRHLGITDQEFSVIAKRVACSPDLNRHNYSYSNFAYMLLGKIIRAISGRGALEFIKSEILNPLNLTQTTWNPEGVHAIGYVIQEQEPQQEQYYHCQSDIAVFGGLWSTTADLAIWVDHLQQSAQEELSQGYISRFANRWKLPGENSEIEEICDYGFGLVRSQVAGRTYISHSGGLPGYGSHLRFNLETGIGIIAMSNLRYAPMMTFSAGLLAKLLSHQAGKEELHTNYQNLAQQILDLLVNYQESVEQQVFAHNIFLDYPIGKLRIDFVEYARYAGGNLQIINYQHERAGFFVITIEGTANTIEVGCSVGPEILPKIQKITFSFSS